MSIFTKILAVVLLTLCTSAVAQESHPRSKGAEQGNKQAGDRKLDTAGSTKQQAPEDSPIQVGPVHIHKDLADHLYLAGYILVTLLLVAVTGYQAVLLRGTLRATEIAASAATKAANTAELALKISERADVLLESAGLSTGQTIDPESRVLLRFKNYGRTRANNATFRINVVIPGLPDLPPNALPPIPIAAGETQLVTFLPFRKRFTEATFSEILSGHTIVSFRGIVSYDDVFGDPHRTQSSGTLNHRTCTFMVDENRAD